MWGVLLLTAYVCLGAGIANRLLPDETAPVRLWAGGILGLVGQMWTVVPFAFLLGFTPKAHVLGLALFFACWLALLPLGRPRREPAAEAAGDRRAPVLTLGLISAAICVLLTTHVIAPGPDGGLYVGQATFGDLSLHLGIVTSLVTQGRFPPEYSIFPGHRLSYPFLVDSLSSSLHLFGTPLRWAILLPSYALVVLLVAGFFLLAYEVLCCRRASLLATVLFFLNGGFGFAYFLDKARTEPGKFWRMFTAFYQTPTNLNEQNIRWSNTICDMIIPQRTTLAGWTCLMLVLWLLLRGTFEKGRRYYVLAGVLAGLLPMIHTHSFLGVGILSAVWLPVFVLQAEDRGACLLNWVWFGGIALAFAVPQLAYWTFTQTGAEGFSKVKLGWVNDADFTLWFWLKNAGVVFALLFPALVAGDKRTWSIYSGAAALFVISNVYIFQPNEYDNNKLLYVWYAFTAIVVAGYLTRAYRSLGELQGRRVLAGMILFFALFSGLLTLGREFRSSYEFQLFSPHAVAAARFIKAWTPPDALFISSDNHNNPISSLAGRNVFSGTPVFLAFHGVNYDERARQVEAMYTRPSEFAPLAEKNRIDYVYFSDYERDHFKVGPQFFQRGLPVAFRQGDVWIFAVSPRARGLLLRPVHFPL